METMELMITKSIQLDDMMRTIIHSQSQSELLFLKTVHEIAITNNNNPSLVKKMNYPFKTHMQNMTKLNNASPVKHLVQNVTVMNVQQPTLQVQQILM